MASRIGAKISLSRRCTCFAALLEPTWNSHAPESPMNLSNSHPDNKFSPAFNEVRIGHTNEYSMFGGFAGIAGFMGPIGMVGKSLFEN